jgi:hypothetical protein
MQLKIQRTQRMGGAFGNKVLFCLDVRAEYTDPEQTNIKKYKLGGEIIYSSQAARKHIANAGAHLDRTQSRDLKEQAAGLAHGIYSMAMAKMNLNISIASLGRGQHIECKDLSELMEAQEAVMGACRHLRDYLDLAATFNGSIILVDFTDGEKVHLSDGKLQLAGPEDVATAQGSLPGEGSADPVIDGEFTSPADRGGTGAYDLPISVSTDQLEAAWARIRAAYVRNPTPFQMGGLGAAALILLMLLGLSILTVLLAGGLIGFAFILGRRRGTL